MRLLTGAIFLTVACSFGTTDVSDLPDAVSILSDEYHEAYRLLPDDPESLHRIEHEFADFNLEEWKALEADTGGYEAGSRQLNLGGGVLPMLQSAAGHAEDRQWVADRIRPIDPDAAEQFLGGENVFELTTVLRDLVEGQGFYREVEEISLRFSGRKEGQSQETIDRAVKQSLALMDYLDALGKLGTKERAVRRNEVGMCVLLMELVVRADPFTTVVDGRCDIDRALDMAKPSTS